MHLSTDWSHRHVVFSAPGSMQQAVKLQNEPRYWHQWFRRYARTVQAANPNATGLERVFDEGEGNDDHDHRGHPRHRAANDPLHRDWGMSLGAGATGGDEMYPAKFTFDVNAAPSCTNDFVVFNTGVAGGVPTAASRAGSFTAVQPVAGNTVTIGVTEVLTATVAAVAATGTATIAAVPNAGDTVTIGATTYTFDNVATGTVTLAAVPNAGDTVTIGSTTYTFDAVATGTVTLVAVPNVGDTVTIGSTVYTFVTTLVNPNDVLIVAASSSNSATNLRAAIDGINGQCFNAPSACFGGGTTANGSVTATAAGNVVTVRAITPGAAGNSIALATTSGGRITLSGATLSGGSGNFANPNEVLIVSGSTANSATNLRAAIDGSAGQCFVSPCYGTGTTANASVTATAAGNVVTVRAITPGAAGNSIALATTSGGRITLSGATLSGGIDAGSNTGTNFLIGANTTATATNLAAAITRNGGTVGVAGASSARVVTVTATVAGTAGNSITLATTISSTSFTWGGPTLAGGALAPGTIIGFNNLYSTQNGVTPAGLCGSAGPNLLFTFNTDVATSGSGPATTGATTSSPVLSGDGSKIAFVESGDPGGAILRLLKWDNNSGGASPIAPDTIIPAGSPWSGCNLADPTISCLIGLRFGNAAQDSESAPFYVYDTDTLYTGDDTGKLHKFINVFGISGSTPSEVTTGGWPVTVNAGSAHLHSPIYDGVSGNIFIGDLAGNAYYVKEAGSSVGVCSSGSHGGVVPCLGTTNGAAGGPTSIALGGVIDDAPIVDITTQRVFFFDGSVNSTTCAAVGTNAALVQLDTQLTSSTEVKVCLPNNATTGQTTNMKSGAFDNAYISSAMGNKTGKLYFCARNPITGRDHPALFRIGFAASGVMKSTADDNSGGSGNNFLDLVGGSQEECSPITEIYNPNTSTDWLFLSVGNNASLGTCATAAGGCLMSFNLTTLGLTTWPPVSPFVTGSYPLPVSPSSGGSSGIIVDNVSSAAQASSIYFTFLTSASTNATCNGSTSAGCAVKLTQNGLQ